MNQLSLNVAVVGATGTVGEALLEILAERQFPLNEIHALASEQSEGEGVVFGKKSLRVKTLDKFDFSKVDLAFFVAGGAVSRKYVPKAVEAGCIVIDNSSEFRYDPDIPLVVPEVNSEAIADVRERNIIANPNCSTIQMLVALKPIYDAVGIVRINVATYQAVSGSGRKGIAELSNQTLSLLSGKEVDIQVYPKQIAFNVIPQIDEFQDNGFTREEMKLIWETKKILNDPKIGVNPTAVRVPVFFGHSEAINIETQRYLDIEEAKALLKKAPGIMVMDSEVEYPTAINEGNSQDAVFIGRIRQDLSMEHGLNFWVVSDNVRKGAALNAVQIAEILIRDYW